MIAFKEIPVGKAFDFIGWGGCIKLSARKYLYPMGGQYWLAAVGSWYAKAYDGSVRELTEHEALQYRLHK